MSRREPGDIGDDEYHGLPRPPIIVHNPSRRAVKARALVHERSFISGGTEIGARDEGFEPSAFCPESSVSTAFRASVAANLHS
jgi:hypothetical protein